jgi:hypothetical protein
VTCSYLESGHVIVLDSVLNSQEFLRTFFLSPGGFHFHLYSGTLLHSQWRLVSEDCVLGRLSVGKWVKWPVSVSVARWLKPQYFWNPVIDSCWGLLLPASPPYQAAVPSLRRRAPHREWTRVMLGNTRCSQRHSFCASGFSSGLSTRLTLTRLSRGEIMRESYTGWTHVCTLVHGYFGCRCTLMTIDLLMYINEYRSFNVY